jgi:multiple sugar transport system permease protein
MTVVSTSTTTTQRRRLIISSESLRDNITGWLFILPAVVIIAVFGIFPILYAAYMSIFQWVIRPRFTYCLPHLEGIFQALPRNQRNDMVQAWQLDFATEVAPNFDLGACFNNYTRQIGSWDGLILFIAGFAVLIGAWAMWQRIFQDAPTEEKQRKELSAYLRGMIAVGVLAIGVIFIATDSNMLYGALASVFIPLGLGLLGYLLFGDMKKLAVAVAVLAVGLILISRGWTLMFDSGNQKFLNGLVYTVYYALASVPIQLGLGLLLAYTLFQNIQGKTLYRMIFFIPYITPAVAAATVFRIIFSPRPSSLMNQAIGLVGLEPQNWIAEPAPFVNALFGWDWQGFFAGPSMAMVSVVILGIWTFTGYNAIIYLAGLGNIPKDLYEAARVDGANEWQIFRSITLPLISPITFYLSILAFIGTFKAFNTIYVMRSPEARGTTDTAAIVVFDTFRGFQQYGEATAQAIILLLIILAITQFQRSFIEKRVFYG